jgi:phosphoribosylanthranilate isomerase
MALRVKICGITRPEQGKPIVDIGATALGFICARQSSRYVTPTQIREIVAELPINAVTGSPMADRIGVFVNASLKEIGETVTIGNLSGVQLHGDESPDFCYQLRCLQAHVEIIKALRIRSGADLDRAKVYETWVDTLLLDAYHPTLAGGTGKTLDWKMLQHFQPACSWLLAGGLTPDNILEALEHSNPNGIDLSSGVERAPGDKDLEKVRRLFEQLSRRFTGSTLGI